MILYRPVGLKEMELIVDSNYKEFPPRLDWQPIFYPVLNKEYAEQIANDWNTKDEFSGYIGFVTSFELDNSEYDKYSIQNVGGFIHNELWVPSENLKEFNKNIINKINISNIFIGDKFNISSVSNTHLSDIILNF
jgi:hypothetical protein